MPGETLTQAIEKFIEEIDKAILNAKAKGTAIPILRLFVTKKDESKPNAKRPGLVFIQNLGEENESIKNCFNNIQEKLFKRTTITKSQKTVSWDKIKKEPKIYAQVCKNTDESIKNFSTSLGDTDIEKTLKTKLEKCKKNITKLGSQENLKLRNAYKKRLSKKLSSSDKKIYQKNTDRIQHILKIKRADFYNNYCLKIFNGEKIEVNHDYINILQSALENIITSKLNKANTDQLKIGHPLTDLFKDVNSLKNNETELVSILNNCKAVAHSLLEKAQKNLSKTQFNTLTKKINDIFGHSIKKINVNSSSWSINFSSLQIQCKNRGTVLNKWLEGSDFKNIFGNIENILSTIIRMETEDKNFEEIDSLKSPFKDFKGSHTKEEAIDLISATQQAYNENYQNRLKKGLSEIHFSQVDKEMSNMFNNLLDIVKV